jgi:transcriptional regulator NrdR family protein
MQFKVIKADGTTEGYLHTKVLAAINNALGTVGQLDVEVAEELAEAVTYFLHSRQGLPVVTSGEILSMIKAVLTATNYENAALALSEHHFERKLKRSRVEVVSVDIQQLADLEALCKDKQLHNRSRWDKSQIINDLTIKYNIDRQTARTIASMVEEKLLNLGIALVPVGLIKQLVLSDTAAVLHAEQQLAAT